MFYVIARFICFVFFKICFRLKIFGRENFPKKGPLIVASNHVSFFDPIIAGVGAPRSLYFLARDSLFKVKLFSKILYSVNAFPIKREKRDINAFRMSLDKLSQGKAIFIFPEGTRSKDGSLQRPKYGIGFLEAKSGASIVPCYIKGSDRALPRDAIFPRFRQIAVYYGKPVKFDKNISGDKKEQYMYIAEQVMKAIGELKEKADKIEFRNQ